MNGLQAFNRLFQRPDRGGNIDRESLPTPLQYLAGRHLLQGKLSVIAVKEPPMIGVMEPVS